MGATLQFLSHPYLSQIAHSNIRVFRCKQPQQAINCDPGLEVELKSKLALTSIEGLMGSAVQFVDRDAEGAEATYFNGAVEALQTMPVDSVAREIEKYPYQYQLTIFSDFYRLQSPRHARVFRDVDLNHMLSSVFEGAGIARDAYAFHFKPGSGAPFIEAATQLNESDDDFMRRHLAQHDLFFMVRHKKQGSVLHIADSLTSLPFSVTGSNPQAMTGSKPLRFKLPLPYFISEIMEASPPMDRQGRYAVAKHAAPIPLLQPYGGAEETRKTGLHFPLPAGAKTVLQCIDNDIDQTVIIGSLFTDEALSPVTSNNPHEMILRTGEDNQLRFSDFPVPCIELNTRDQKNLVGLYEGEEASRIDFIAKEGALLITAAKDIQISSQGRHTQAVTGHYEAKVKGDHILHVKGEEDRTSQLRTTETLALKADQDCLFNTTENVLMKTQHAEMTIDVGQDMTWQAGGDLHLGVSQGDAVCEVGGGVRLQAGQAIALTTPASSLVLSSDCLVLRADRLRMSAQKIVVEAIDFKVN